jgi:GNAT superfamily N-acetyltransferase
MSISILRPRPEQIEGIFDLILRCDIEEYGEPDSELSDLQHEWDRIDLQTDAWVAEDSKNGIIGYAALIPAGELRFDVYIDPELADIGLMRDLLARCEGRAWEIAKGETLEGQTYLAHVNERDREIFIEAGFGYTKSYYQMHIDLDDSLEQPSWPDGIQLRTAIPEQDDPEIYRVVQIFFGRGEDDEPTFAQWKAHMIRPDLYDPNLWFLAVSGDHIVGTCLGIKYETEGWIRQFGVLPDWRGRGIATAMLRHAFLVFRDRGYNRAGLGMEAENENAMRLYERLGMRVLRQYDEYRKIYSST